MSNRDNNKEQLFANNTAEKMMIYLPDSSSVILYPDANVSYNGRHELGKGGSSKRKGFFQCEEDARKGFQGTVRKSDGGSAGNIVSG